MGEYQDIVIKIMGQHLGYALYRIHCYLGVYLYSCIGYYPEEKESLRSPCLPPIT